MTETKARRRAGRPRVFDTDAALDKAVRLFWQRGYEATSMADLVAETGVAAASLYAAFDNKAGLFAAVIERYAATFSVHLYAPINDPALSTYEAQRPAGTSGVIILGTWNAGRLLHVFGSGSRVAGVRRHRMPAARQAYRGGGPPDRAFTSGRRAGRACGRY